MPSDRSLWYALPDVIADKLLTGKSPKIIRAIQFVPKGKQTDLKPITIVGNLTINPNEDLFLRLRQLRVKIQKDRDRQEDSAQYTQLQTVQKQLKILANATSYGIFIEINTEDRPCKNIDAYGLRHFITKASKSETCGVFFNPIIATMLTSGARLILAMAEAWLTEHHGYYAFCDTDSMAVSPRHWMQLQKFFQPLNPYSFTQPLLELEYDEKDENGHRADLWFYGISAKRYALYRLVNGNPVLVDDGWSSHGLGHLLHGNSDDPHIRKKWETQLWTRIIETTKGKLSEAALSEEYTEYAVSKFGVTRPSLHRRLKTINRAKDYSSQIKPYNFVLVGQPAELGDNDEPIHPITKFTSSIEEAPFQPFIDYNTGKRYVSGTELYWKQLPELIREYLNHHESKFNNGQQIGNMKRRHLQIARINYIGKETNEIEKTEIFGTKDDSPTKYY